MSINKIIAQLREGYLDDDLLGETADAIESLRAKVSALETGKAAISQLSNSDGYAENLEFVKANQRIREALVFCYSNLDDFAFEHCEDEVIKAKQVLALLTDTAAPTPDGGSIHHIDSYGYKVTNAEWQEYLDWKNNQAIANKEDK